MSIKQEYGEASYNDLKIQQLVTKLVAPAFQPLDLLDYVKNYVFDEEAITDVEALYAALDSRYPSMKAEYDRMNAVERANSRLAIEIDLVHQNAMFCIGLAVGQRVRL